jgi:hypothetical protein
VSHEPFGTDQMPFLTQGDNTPALNLQKFCPALNGLTHSPATKFLETGYMKNHLIAGLFGGVYLSFAAHANAAINLGFMQVGGAVTIDASTPEFQFTTFEILSGGSVNFINLEVSDTLILNASEAIRINGLLAFAPALAIRFEAPLIELGEGTVADVAGGGAGSLTGIYQPRRVDLPGNTDARNWPILERGGDLSLQAPVPEADTCAMMLAGLGLVGYMARRRKLIMQAAG